MTVLLAAVTDDICPAHLADALADVGDALRGLPSFEASAGRVEL